MNDFQGLYDVRDAVSNDTNLIMATFLRGLYYGDSWFSTIPKDVFMENYRKIIEGLINHPKVVVKVACLKEDRDVILGYSILSVDYQHVIWVHVKRVWRLKGIARSLTPSHPTSVTHLTALGKTLLPKLNGAIFNPFWNSNP